MAKTDWIVRRRGFEEVCAGRQDALDRWGQLDARGIEAELIEVTGWGRERQVSLVDTQRFVGASADRTRLSHPQSRQREGDIKNQHVGIDSER
jgi:hypothetical protein